MTKNKGHSRRTFLTGCAATGVLVLTGMTLMSCGSKSENSVASEESAEPVRSCDDLSGVSENDLALRKKLGYVKESPMADNQCQNCNLYLPPKLGHTCGACMLFKGPVYQEGYCTYWAPKV
jgi:hypothetical protein